MLSIEEIKKHKKHINVIGLTVVKLPEEITDNFDDDIFLREQREYLNPDPNADKYVLGGFRAYGNGSSYHHPQIRQVREKVYEYLFPIFQAVHGSSDNYIELMADRFARRNKSVPVSVETWHRDATINYEETNINGVVNVIYGGWTNLDKTQTQYFSFVPRSHKGVNLKTGFSKISEEEANMCENNKKVIVVPPYHCIIFNELLRHEVLKIKPEINTPQFSCRLYHKYRISNTGKSLLGEDYIKDIIYNQSPFNLHEKGLPPMYARMHIFCWRQQLVEFSKNIHPAFKSITKRGDYILNRYFGGLRQAQLELYPDYRENEVAILLPRKL